MEGPSIREFPRMVLNLPVELRVANRRLPVKAQGNLSAGGLFVEGQKLPVGTPVEVKIAATSSFGAEGIVRYSAGNGQRGVGIEFTSVSDAERRHLDQVIEEVTRQGAPAC